MPKGKKRAAEANMEASGTSSKTTKKSKGNVSEDGCHVFFFGIDCTFSQFHPAKFTDSDGREYNCMEQYMHYHKAVTFKDDEMAKKIMETDDPKQHKKYGRQVQNFDADVWKAKSLEVVFDGSILKYKQNPEMKEVLFATSSKTLVEASPRDRLWGVGMGQNNPKIHNPANWRGKNLLGKTLTQVRDKLMKDEQAV